MPVGSARTSSSRSGVISKPSGLDWRKPAERSSVEIASWTVASSAPAAIAAPRSIASNAVSACATCGSTPDEVIGAPANGAGRPTASRCGS